MSFRRQNRAVVRSASHAGSWYSDDPSLLNAQLEDWLCQVEQSQSNVCAIIAPHAGYSYSGSTAAFAYKHFPSSGIKRVFILGPSHHFYLNKCAVTRTSVYQTPLGNLTIDQDTNRELLETGMFDTMDLSVDEEEHSIELHLPYIAKCLGDSISSVVIVPILVGSINRRKEVEYGQLLSRYVADPENFFVISSDFCHWGRRFSFQPYDESLGEIHEFIEQMDKQGMSLIEAGNAFGFSEYLEQTKNTICGRHPIAVLLHALRYASSAEGEVPDQVPESSFGLQFVKYSQSNPCRSTRDSSVSYASGIVFTRE